MINRLEKQGHVHQSEEQVLKNTIRSAQELAAGLGMDLGEVRYKMWCDVKLTA